MPTFYVHIAEPKVRSGYYRTKGVITANNELDAAKLIKEQMKLKDTAAITLSVIEPGVFTPIAKA